LFRKHEALNQLPFKKLKQIENN